MQWMNFAGACYRLLHPEFRVGESVSVPVRFVCQSSTKLRPFFCSTFCRDGVMPNSKYKFEGDSLIYQTCNGCMEELGTQDEHEEVGGCSSRGTEHTPFVDFMSALMLQ